MSRLVVLCGIPGSGKTTFARELARNSGASLYCFDERPKAFSPTFSDFVRAQMWKEIADDLRNGYDVICDDANTLLRWRAGILAATEGTASERVLVTMDVPLDVCLERNKGREFCLPDFVLYESSDQYEEPSLKEGWDKIINKPCGEFPRGFLFGEKGGEEG